MIVGSNHARESFPNSSLLKVNSRDDFSAFPNKPCTSDANVHRYGMGETATVSVCALSTCDFISKFINRNECDFFVLSTDVFLLSSQCPQLGDDCVRYLSTECDCCCYCFCCSYTILKYVRREQLISFSECNHLINGTHKFEFCTHSLIECMCFGGMLTMAIEKYPYNRIAIAFGTLSVRATYTFLLTLTDKRATSNRIT